MCNLLTEWQGRQERLPQALIVRSLHGLRLRKDVQQRMDIRRRNLQEGMLVRREPTHADAVPGVGEVLPAPSSSSAGEGGAGRGRSDRERER